ncbi:ABC-type transport system involved in multi-copper enzyme maturation permease subunit [Kribbella aluminosa]|uniref:ABC-type transport system involved in multi-copper enzyme maturation permease subunit n=1 Tax=Kribbella aluminosa TaxID=416017 RepID=A0ABS4UW34_9ACTN|nr:ABC transporter permease [Kribbella aluminosa]MBP2355830.1 ABC-type transport system involved in multi-copper enzyme maturation permease subunit [Kribbella aluminosa]
MIPVVASEWTKLRSVRSTPLSLLAAAAVSIAGALFSATGRAAGYAALSPADKLAFDPVNLSFDGLAFAQLAFGVLGALAITSEYTTGQIRTTFTAVPRRLAVLLAKAAVTATTAIVAGGVLAFACFFVAQAGLHREHLDVSLGSPGALRAVLGATAYLLTLTLLGVGLGALIRHTAGAISTLFALVFILPVVAARTSDWATWPTKWNLWSAGNALISTPAPPPNSPSLLQGLLICVAYAVLPLALSLVLVLRRDA